MPHHADDPPQADGDDAVAPVRSPRRRRVLTALAVLLLLLLAVPMTAAAVMLENPAALQSLSAHVLPAQHGTHAWNGRTRLVIALFGLTQRTTEPARTDTILILTLDPAHHHASLLSVPRDLWVDIPGYGPDKLALAYEIGGPRLAVYTLQRDLGIPVQYYAALTFRGFIRLVDALGGVTVDVPQELNDPTYPCLTTTATCPIDLKPGVQHLDGATALEFVRERHAFAQQDLARVRDQQAFLSALRHQALQPQVLLRVPALLALARHAVITDLPASALPSLALAYARVPAAQVTHAYIDVASGLVQSGWSADGQSILTPSAGGGIAMLVRRLTHDPVVGERGAAVTVWDGTGTAGLAGAVGGLLHRDGFMVAAVGATPHAGRTHTVLVRNTLVRGSAATEQAAQELAQMLQVPVRVRPERGARTPLVVLLGSDWPPAHG